MKKVKVTCRDIYVDSFIGKNVRIDGRTSWKDMKYYNQVGRIVDAGYAEEELHCRVKFKDGYKEWFVVTDFTMIKER